VSEPKMIVDDSTGELRLFVERDDGSRYRLSADQQRFFLAVIGLGFGTSVVLTTEYRPIDVGTVDGGALLERLGWSQAKAHFVAAELAELGLDVRLGSEQPE